MSHQVEVNVAPGNGLLPPENKPLPELMLTQIFVAMAPFY